MGRSEILFKKWERFMDGNSPGSTGEARGPFITKPDRDTGDMTMDIYRNVFDDYARSGEGRYTWIWQGFRTRITNT